MCLNRISAGWIYLVCNLSSKWNKIVTVMFLNRHSWDSRCISLFVRNSCHGMLWPDMFVFLMCSSHVIPKLKWIWLHTGKSQAFNILIRGCSFWYVLPQCPSVLLPGECSLHCWVLGSDIQKPGMHQEIVPQHTKPCPKMGTQQGCPNVFTAPSSKQRKDVSLLSVLGKK